MQNIKKKPIYKLTLSAILVALGTVLSLIPAIKLPFGGSITILSMLPIIMISLILGIKWGVVSSFVYSLIQLFFGITISGLFGWGLTPVALVGCILLDYLLAFTVLGFAGIFSRKSYAGGCIGTVCVIVLRFVCHYISGVVIFREYAEGTFLGISLVNRPYLYSFVYNGIYMIPELIITAIAAFILLRLPQIRKLINGNP